jgi:outer membrane protein assembly factor BamB
VDDEASRFVVGDSEGIVYLLDSSGKVVSRGSLVSEVISVAPGGKPGIIVAVGNENVAYVMDTQASLLWTHVEVGFEFGAFDVAISTDGKRTRLAYPGGSVVLDETGKRIFTFFDTGSLLTSDGKLMVILTAKSIGDHDWKPVLAWFDVDAGRQVMNVTLGEDETVESLSVSDNGSLLAVSGSVADKYAFIYAFDSQGHRLWEHANQREEPCLLVHSSVQVSGDGLYVAAARWESGIFGGGTNNGVVLFKKNGEVLWNYTTQEFASNVAVTEDGEYVAAGSSSKIYEFDSLNPFILMILGLVVFFVGKLAKLVGIILIILGAIHLLLPYLSHVI